MGGGKLLIINNINILIKHGLCNNIMARDGKE